MIIPRMYMSVRIFFSFLVDNKIKKKKKIRNEKIKLNIL